MRIVTMRKSSSSHVDVGPIVVMSLLVVPPSLLLEAKAETFDHLEPLSVNRKHLKSNHRYPSRRLIQTRLIVEVSDVVACLWQILETTVMLHTLGVAVLTIVAAMVKEVEAAVSVVDLAVEWNVDPLVEEVDYSFHKPVCKYR
jgi:hypothetical protein